MTKTRRGMAVALALCGGLVGGVLHAPRPGAAATYGSPWQVTNVGTSRCIESGGPGTTVRSSGCSGATEQFWFGGAVTGTASYRDFWRQCLTGDASGTVRLAACGAAAAQQWTHGSDRTLRNAATGACLDDDTFSGTLSTKPCTGSVYQQWDLITQLG